MKKYFTTAIIALSCLFTLSLTEAGGAIPVPNPEYHWYFGGGVNYIATAHFRIDSYPNGAITHNPENIGFDVFAGVQANEYFGGEVGYSNLNKWVFEQVRSENLDQISSTIKLWNLHFFGTARYPVIGHTLYLFVLAGVAWFNNKAKGSADSSSGLPEQNATSSIINFMYGAGAEADFGRWELRLAYNTFNTDFVFLTQPPSPAPAVPHFNYLVLSLIVRF